MDSADWTIKELFKGREIVASTNARTLRRVFLVKIPDSNGTSQEDAANFEGIPAIGDRENGIPVVQKNCSLLSEDCKTIYKVTVEYQGNANSSGFNDGDKPWEQSTKFSYDTREYQVPMEHDYSKDQKPFRNSAGDLFATLPMDTITDIIVTATRNRLSYHFSSVWNLCNTCNKDAIIVEDAKIPPGCAKLKGWSASEQTYTDANNKKTTYFAERIEIQLRTRGFRTLKILDCGFNELDESGKKKRILTPDGKPAVIEQLLDGAGHKLDTSSATPSDQVGHYLEFVGCPESDWGRMLPL